MRKEKPGKNEEQNKKDEDEKTNKYDRILKENIESVLLPLTEKYFNFKIIESKPLDAKLQSTIEREVDFLQIVKTAKGEEFILHIEFQSKNDSDMIYRFKEYDGIIQRKHKPEDEDRGKPKGKRLDIHHYVIFLGKGKMTMRTQLPEKHVFHGFDVLNLNQLDFDEMLQSQIPEEIILAILSNFKGKDPEQIIRLIMEKLKKCSNSGAELKKFVQQLKVLSRLRKLEEKTIKTINNMPITYNLEDDYSYQLGMEKGIERGTEKGRNLERKVADLELEQLKQQLEQQLRKAIVAMLILGNHPEDIAKNLEVPVAWVMEIQQDLN